MHDKGIDGLEYVSHDEPQATGKKIYQLSIRGDAKKKIRETIRTLKSNEIEFSQLIYGTNRVVKDQHVIVDEILSSESVFVQIYDMNWFATNINHNPHAIRVFNRFVENHFHVDNRPVRGFELVDVTDPRIYVYLRQFVERPGENRKLDEILIDTLIIMALEGTDSTKGLFRSKYEVIDEIQSIRRFDPSWLEDMVTKRLGFFATKPRQVRHHRKPDVYCLPYETRRDLELCRRNDEKLYATFMEESLSMFNVEVRLQNIDTNIGHKLLVKAFHEIFHQQGLEFSAFIASGDGATSIEKSLHDIVETVTNASNVPPKLTRPLGEALLNTMREIVYNGSSTQLEFLRKLSSTYRMLFLLQCDPKLVKFFEVMANKLVIYVDSSILIPAFSDYYLNQQNQRYTSLLTGAQQAGITLRVTNIVIEELAAHLIGLKRTFWNLYESREHHIDSKGKIRLIDDMLIRAYFHAKHAGKVTDFRTFYETFATWNSKNEEGEIIEWLKARFNIEYEDTLTQDLHIDPQEAEELFQRLRDNKPSDTQARSDVKQLLHIYAVREKNNELGKGGAFGYDTWWLTSDTRSQRAFLDLGKTRSRKNPYIRADFLYSFIDLAPSRHDVKRIYKKLFPTLLGVNISYFEPSEVRQQFSKFLREQKKVAGTPAYLGRVKSMSEEIKQGRLTR